ncbi:MAG: hypothetical protein LJE95_03200 [Acidobacteria bacterium]|nr:hypothetical protein [Acidobacteriota bacterium]
MKRLGVWWVPLLLILLPLSGKVPLAHDLEDFFLPVRAHTARRLAAGDLPWLNQDDGCGEAWFANPETGVLYPPQLAYLVVGPEWGISFEVAFHLALLALGIGLLARRLGTEWRGRWFAEAAAWTAGPVLATIGVVNNLDTLAWLPWIVLGARRDDRWAVPASAAATAMAWLGGEPQLWAIGVGLAVLVAVRRRRAVAGVVLGGLIVAVQMVPFAYWIAEGDRGSGAASAYLAGALSPAGWLRLLVPGTPASGTGFPFLASLFVGAPVLLCIALGLGRRRRMLVPIAVLAVLATLPAIGLSGAYLFLTRELVRYPSRLAGLAVVCALPFAGPGAEAWLSGRGRAGAVVLGLLTLPLVSLADAPLAAAAAAAAAIVLCLAAAWPARAWLREIALVAGLASCAVGGWSLLGLRAPDRSQPPWPEAAGSRRLYSPPPPLTSRVVTSPNVGERRLWPVGYLNLSDGLSLARTYAPVANAVLERHVAAADAGPTGRWWLDTLAASWVLLPHPAGIANMEPVGRRGGLWLHDNRTAWPEVVVAQGPAVVGRQWRPAGGQVTLVNAGNGLQVNLQTARPAWLIVSMAPVAGWRWQLDGRPVDLRRGPGILQQVRCPAGAHRLDGTYLPPHVGSAAVCSVFAVLVLLGLIASAIAGRGGRAWRGRGSEE